MSTAASLNGPRIGPASGRAPRHLVVLLHGYGADGKDLIGLADYWERMLPDAVFVAPNAPQRVPGSPFGFQWFSLDSYDPNALRRDPVHAPAVFEAMDRAAASAAAGLDAFLDQELQRHGLGDGNMALIGFSQGTMMALYVGLRRRHAPAGIVGYSGALLGAGRLAEEATAKPPVLLVHGDMDEVVPVQAMFAAAQGLGAAGVPVQWHVSRGIPHSIAPDGLALAGQFLGKVLPAR